MRRTLIGIAVVMVLALLWQSRPIHRPWQRCGKKAVIIGVDGFDPELVDRMLASGKLPAFARIIERGGSYSRLRTALPPQSPVAWAEFISGNNPGKNNIFDFIHLDKSTYQPYLSIARVNEPKNISVGSWRIPIYNEEIQGLRKGVSFWEICEQQGINCTVIRIPSNFPPVSTRQRTLSGMGTPDLRGGYGTALLFTESPAYAASLADKSGVEAITLRFRGSAAQTELPGPKPGMSIPMKIVVKDTSAAILIEDNVTVLNQGEWSDWIRVTFEGIPYVKSVHAITRMYVGNTEHGFTLLVYPLQIDPLRPLSQVSTPENFAADLYRKYGGYPLQGMPEMPKLVEHGILSEDEWLAHAYDIFHQHEEMLMDELDRLDDGIMFYYLSFTDLVSHIFFAAPDQEVITRVYEDMDRVIGRVLNRIDESTLLVIMSDHGFKPVTREFNLNAFLEAKGYLSVLEPDNRSAEFLMNVDLNRTRAFGLGLNGLYLRNADTTEEAKLIADLEAVVDPKTGSRVIKKVYRSREVYRGDYLATGPDLIVGYYRGYNVNSDSAKGMVTTKIFSDNESKWRSDHCIDPDEVPGVLFSNRPTANTSPRLRDVMPSVLAWLGVKSTHTFDGEDLCLQKK